MMNAVRRCLVIPAVKKNAVIPDQLVKNLAGKTLIQRAIDNAKCVVPDQDIYVVTDSEEISLICERNGVTAIYDAKYRIASLDIVSSLITVLKELAKEYEHLVIYRASCPLITGEDIEDAYAFFVQQGSDCLVTVKNIKYRLWRESEEDIGTRLFNDEQEEAYIETKALFMIKSASLDVERASLKISPYFLNSRSIEIESYQDWWICEKILQSKHIVFVVAGYPAIGMGHIFRALMLAHEITDHRITFFCTTKSELAASNIIAKDYSAKLQKTEDLAAEVIRLKPDLVVNDFLNTEEEYVRCLKKYGAKVVNFEDQGTGAEYADLVVNALYERHTNSDSRFLYGYENFCLRDEFVTAKPMSFRDKPKEVLITFGGTDEDNFTRDALEVIAPFCLEKGIHISLVTGPGYAHKKSLESRVTSLNAAATQKNFASMNAAKEVLEIPTGSLQSQTAENASTYPFIHVTHITNVMSRYMERADFAICSAGRTVYELTHMRVPAIVMAHHEREDMHTFAREDNGFIYLGIMKPFDKKILLNAFEKMMQSDYRKELHARQSGFDFTQNKRHVVAHILSLLKDA